MLGINGRRIGSSDWTTWEYDPNSVWTAPVAPESEGAAVPARQHGGPVRSLAAMGQPGQPLMGQPYRVGEAGPEMYVPDAGGQPQMVGMEGPEIRSFEQPGQIIPNHELTGPGRTYNLSDLGDGTYGMPDRPGGMREGFTGRPGGMRERAPQRPWHRPFPGPRPQRQRRPMGMMAGGNVPGLHIESRYLGGGVQNKPTQATPDGIRVGTHG